MLFSTAETKADWITKPLIVNMIISNVSVSSNGTNMTSTTYIGKEITLHIELHPFDMQYRVKYGYTRVLIPVWEDFNRNRLSLPYFHFC